MTKTINKKEEILNLDVPCTEIMTARSITEEILKDIEVTTRHRHSTSTTTNRIDRWMKAEKGTSIQEHRELEIETRHREDRLIEIFLEVVQDIQEDHPPMTKMNSDVKIEIIATVRLDARVNTAKEIHTRTTITVGAHELPI